MSGIIAGAGSSFPNDFVNLDWSVATFTVASGATGNTFAIANTVKPVTINSAYNTNPNNIVWALSNFGTMSCVVTTNTTDNVTLQTQFSIDNQVTWSTFTSLTVNGGQQNKAIGGPSNGFALASISNNAAAVTNNTIFFRLAVNDATSPTTDALTMTNIRVTISVTVTK